MPPDDRCGLEQRDAVPEQREIVRAADARRAGAHDRHPRRARRPSRAASPSGRSGGAARPSGFSTPCRSVTVRLSARIEMGWSMVPRRHFVSHGCAQMRPQIEASGLGARAMA